MSTPAADIITASLDEIRARLYDRRAWSARFYPERDMLISAITWLATWFRKRGVAPSVQRYRAIIARVVQDIDRHMRIDQPKCMALYFHACLQKHMQHQGETYYDEAKALRNVLQAVTSKLTERQRSVQAEQAPVETLADIYSQLAAKRRSKSSRT
jgi:hypothetical protein